MVKAIVQRLLALVECAERDVHGIELFLSKLEMAEEDGDSHHIQHAYYCAGLSEILVYEHRQRQPHT